MYCPVMSESQQRHVRGSGDCGGNAKSDFSLVVKAINAGDVPVCIWNPTKEAG